MNPIFFIGPAVAVIGIVSVFFVLRHKAVQTRSMYSSRRSNLERKVRAARTRTLGPEKHVEKAPGAHAAHDAAKLTYEPSAFQGPPVAPPAAPMAAPNQSWDVGPTVPAAAPPPSPPAYTPEPARPPEPVWTPSPPEPAAAPHPTPSPPAQVPAGAGASWSIVGGESKDVPISDDGKKKKKGKRGADESAWQLASGEAPGEESEGEVRGPNTALAVAQWAAVAVGLMAVLIGIMLMIATSHTA
ncbi:MAG TPA: hypothetical protein VGU71_16350 [Candidatus Dormibacteraeota bacterium]|nr:hypothetical protein [Candidatus Dormibacteraeota bacterium]